MASLAKHKIVVHRGADLPGSYTWSPFVTKVEFRHRLSHVAYSCGDGSPSSGPRGKIPWIQLSGEGGQQEILSDSSLITRTLVDRGIFQDLNSSLSAKEKAQDVALRAMFEEKLHFYNARERWIDNYYTMRDYALANIPFPLRYVIGYLAYRGNLSKLHDQGTGRFSPEELRSFRREIWASVNGYLEESRRNASQECFWVLGGKEPTEADATVYGFTVSALTAKAGPESTKMVKQDFPIVVEYATRIHERYFPDYEKWP